MPPSVPSSPTGTRKSVKGSSPRREKLSPTRLAELRRWVEGTARSYQRIGRELGVSPSTISRYAKQEGWQRPPGAALPARMGHHRERVTAKLWRLTERHAQALEEQPVAAAQRSLQSLARLTQILGNLDKHAPRPAPAPPLEEAVDEPAPERGRSLEALRDELAAHLMRIAQEEGEGWEERSWWFEGGGGI